MLDTICPVPVTTRNTRQYHDTPGNDRTTEPRRDGLPDDCWRLVWILRLL